jgi:hypothetical protein
VSLGSPRNRSVDVNDHLGFLRQWTAEHLRKGHFSLWEPDELYNQAYLTAHDLLTSRYRPDRGTVVTYLRNFLWARVAYAYGKYHGWRYRSGKWMNFEAELNGINEPLHSPPPKPELPPGLTEREIDVILMKVGGMTHRDIALAFGRKSPTTVTYWIKNHILPKFESAGLLDD